MLVCIPYELQSFQHIVDEVPEVKYSTPYQTSRVPHWPESSDVYSPCQPLIIELQSESARVGGAHRGSRFTGRSIETHSNANYDMETGRVVVNPRSHHDDSYTTCDLMCCMMLDVIYGIFLSCVTTKTTDHEPVTKPLPSFPTSLILLPLTHQTMRSQTHRLTGSLTPWLELPQPQNQVNKHTTQ